VKKYACSFVVSALLALTVLGSEGGSDGALAGEPLGTAEQARAMLDRAVAALKADQSKALAAFNDPQNKEFRDRDLFVYCFDTGDGKFTAYEMSALIGADIRQFKLYNEPMGQRSYDVVHDAPEGTVVSVDYRMPKPNETKPSAKEALETRVGNQACGVSYFK
jgi:cytochrome c